MICIVKVMGAANMQPTPHDGRYVQSWNPDTKFGELELTSTDKVEEALKFVSPLVALEEWRTISSVQQVRPDGAPNRPLTGLTLKIEKVNDEKRNQA